MSRLILIVVVAALATLAKAGELGSPKEDESQRSLQAVEFFYPDLDVCENEPGVFGPCDTSKFPNCGDKQSICYNRKPRRDVFHPDKVPVFYIDYNRVLCYPKGWSCSSCTPGRYCLAEKRCILDESYPCSQWF